MYWSNRSKENEKNKNTNRNKNKNQNQINNSSSSNNNNNNTTNTSSNNMSCFQLLKSCKSTFSKQEIHLRIQAQQSSLGFNSSNPSFLSSWAKGLSIHPATEVPGCFCQPPDVGPNGHGNMLASKKGCKTWRLRCQGDPPEPGSQAYQGSPW